LFAENPFNLLSMARFEIIYAAEPTGAALLSAVIVARDRSDAVKEADKHFARVQIDCGARCYRVLDAMGMVVARGPKLSASSS
jgi:hypothetical protein